MKKGQKEKLIKEIKLLGEMEIGRGTSEEKKKAQINKLIGMIEIL